MRSPEPEPVPYQSSPADAGVGAVALAPCPLTFRINVAESFSNRFLPVDRKWLALTIVCIAIFMLLLDITVVNDVLPDIQKELQTSFTYLQTVVDSYAMTLA